MCGDKKAGDRCSGAEQKVRIQNPEASIEYETKLKPEQTNTGSWEQDPGNRIMIQIIRTVPI